MKLVAACGDPVLGTRLMFSDLDEFVGETSPYRKLRIMPHLDHGIAGLDDDVLADFVDRFASVMHDASEEPLDENIRLTAEYVERVRGRVVVEGAADEIFEAGGDGQKNEPTTPEQVKRFLSATGVDIVVPNVGTEHRATADQVGYLPERAREISAAVGKVICLHGTSSVRPEQLAGLPSDGFVKINVYTTLAVKGGQALARKVLASLPDIFDEAQLRELIDQGVLGEGTVATREGVPIGPKLESVANPPRRDAWFVAVRDRCAEFMDIFGYGRFAR